MWKPLEAPDKQPEAGRGLVNRGRLPFPYG